VVFYPKGRILIEDNEVFSGDPVLTRLMAQEDFIHSVIAKASNLLQNEGVLEQNVKENIWTCKAEELAGWWRKLHTVFARV
jgi:hypothetical protein